MSNEKHYSTHPGAEHPPTMCMEIPVEEYESIKRENAELKESQRWHDFADKKPEHHQWILVYDKNLRPTIRQRRWDEGCKFDVIEQRIYTHWMPLPSAPKEEK